MSQLGNCPLRTSQWGKGPPLPFKRRPPPSPLPQFSFSISSTRSSNLVFSLGLPSSNPHMRSRLRIASHLICIPCPGAQGTRNLQNYLPPILKQGSWSSTANYHSQVSSNSLIFHLSRSPIRHFSLAHPRFDLSAFIAHTPAATSAIFCPEFDTMKGTTPSPSPVPKASASPTAGTKRKRADGDAKFYGVKVGFTPGIYDNWPDCLAQITGYKKAICELCSRYLYPRQRFALVGS